MNRLPVELVQRILVQVSVPDLLIVALSSKRMRAIARATDRHLARHAAHVSHQLRISASIDNTDFFYLGQMHCLEHEDHRGLSGSRASHRRETHKLANDARFVDAAVSDTRLEVQGAIDEADPNVQRQYENSIVSFFIVQASLVPCDVTRTRLLCHVALFSLAGVSHVVTRSTVVDTRHSVCRAWSETPSHSASDPYANPVNISRTHASTCPVCSFIQSSIQTTSKVELFQYQPIDKNYRVFHRTWNDSIHLELRSGASVILDIEHRDELDFDPNNIWSPHYESDYLDNEQRSEFRVKQNSSAVKIITRRYGLIEDACKARNLERFFGVDSGLYRAPDDESFTRDVRMESVAVAESARSFVNPWQ
ncbi:hypothetical protein HDU78_011571 [Chytriomyces hyalinus]|nr:hypothetical protein HDU78_011571 [Chytriomyces hyalinus]